MNQFSLTYELVGTGWARATLTLDGADTVVTASYISDALRDLIDATSVMTEGGPKRACALGRKNRMSTGGSSPLSKPACDLRSGVFRTCSTRQRMREVRSCSR